MPPCSVVRNLGSTQLVAEHRIPVDQIIMISKFERTGFANLILIRIYAK